MLAILHQGLEPILFDLKVVVVKPTQALQESVGHRAVRSRLLHQRCVGRFEVDAFNQAVAGEYLQILA